MADEPMILSLFLSISVPLTLMLLVFDRKTRHNLIFLIIGTYVCILCGAIDGLIRNKTGADLFYLTTTVTPVVEETAKALPILFYAMFITDGRKRVLAASCALGLGFALLENVFLIAGSSPGVGWALSRSFGAGLMHCGCSIIVGYGMICIRQAKRFFIPNIFAMLTAAIIYHGIFNALSGSAAYRLAPLLSVTVFLALAAVHLRMRAAERMQNNQILQTEDTAPGADAAKQHEKVD